MVNEQNLINLINNKKPVELVQGLKEERKVPSYEKFMKCARTLMKVDALL